MWNRPSKQCTPYVKKIDFSDFNRLIDVSALKNPGGRIYRAEKPPPSLPLPGPSPFKRATLTGPYVILNDIVYV